MFQNQSVTSGQQTDTSPISATRWVARAILVFVGLGILMRLVRYLLCFPLWGDEAALAANLVDREFLDLLRPLDYQQVAPPLFLWIELWIVRHLNFSEWSLRAFPLACSVASLPLFRYAAARFLASSSPGDRLPHGMALALTVALFSVSYYPLRHGVEAKQYASDLFVSLLLIVLALRCLSDSKRVRWMWLLVVFGPIALCLSHPAVFVAAGMSLALVRVVWRRRCLRTWLPFVAYNMGLLAAFAGMYVISTGPQMVAAAAEGIMGSYWSGAFPPITQPLRLLTWLFAIHTGQLFAYPAGGADIGSGAFMFACFAVGTAWLIRRGQGSIVVLCMAPFGLTLLAAAMQKYPYGGYARTSQHLAPVICLVAGAGLARMLDCIRRDGTRRRVQIALLGSLAVFAAGLIVHDIIYPYRTEHDRRVREFARWFWHDKAINSELVCARTDLKQPFFRQTYLWRGIAQYLCNQRIYSARHGNGAERRWKDWGKISSEHPLRCVVYSRPALSRDEVAFAHWLASMQEQFTWVGYERNDFYKPHDHGPDIERIEIYEFVPRYDDVAHDTLLAPEYGVRRFIEPHGN